MGGSNGELPPDALSPPAACPPDPPPCPSEGCAPPPLDAPPDPVAPPIASRPPEAGAPPEATPEPPDPPDEPPLAAPPTSVPEAEGSAASEQARKLPKARQKTNRDLDVNGSISRLLDVASDGTPSSTRRLADADHIGALEASFKPPHPGSPGFEPPILHPRCHRRRNRRPTTRTK